MEQTAGPRGSFAAPGRIPVSPLILDDTFEPYYAGRPGYTAPDTGRRRHAEKAEPPVDEEQSGRTEGRKSRPKPAPTGAEARLRQG
jgi:hypothetical protein